MVCFTWSDSRIAGSCVELSRGRTDRLGGVERLPARGWGSLLGVVVFVQPIVDLSTYIIPHGRGEVKADYKFLQSFTIFYIGRAGGSRIGKSRRVASGAGASLVEFLVRW